MGLVFDVWERGNWVVILWSVSQVFVAIYSIVLMFGTVPIQIVMLYIKNLILVLIFVNLSISTFMFIIPIILLCVSKAGSDDFVNAEYIIYY
jgi:hypothetical protein